MQRKLETGNLLCPPLSEKTATMNFKFMKIKISKL